MPASSVLGSSRASSAGPRLHDYSIPVIGAGGITQLRPGLLGVPTGPGVSGPSGHEADSHAPGQVTPQGSLPVPVPNATSDPAYPNGGYGSVSGKSEPWGSPASLYHRYSSYQSPAVSNSLSGTGGGWSLPRSSLRSVSGSSRSRSASGSRSDDESESVDVDVEVDDPQRFGFSSRGRTYAWKREEEEPSIGFSMREEDEDEDEEVGKGGKETEEEAWDGMEMDMEMD